jgi:hypothetical protein
MPTVYRQLMRHRRNELITLSCGTAVHRTGATQTLNQPYVVLGLRFLDVAVRLRIAHAIDAELASLTARQPFPRLTLSTKRLGSPPKRFFLFMPSPCTPGNAGPGCASAAPVG